MNSVIDSYCNEHNLYIEFLHWNNKFIIYSTGLSITKKTRICSILENPFVINCLMCIRFIILIGLISPTQV